MYYHPSWGPPAPSSGFGRAKVLGFSDLGRAKVLGSSDLGRAKVLVFSDLGRASCFPEPPEQFPERRQRTDCARGGGYPGLGRNALR